MKTNTAKPLTNVELSAFCESLALLLNGGVSCEEAVGLLCEGEESALTKTAQAVQAVYDYSLYAAMEQAQLFPLYVLHMVKAGENSGRLEEAMLGLASYYDYADSAEKKVKGAVLYPTALLVVMSVLLLFIVVKILPVFSGVYGSLSGEMAAQSYFYIQLAYVAGWAIFLVSALAGLGMVTLWLLWRSPSGKSLVMTLLQKIPAIARCIADMELAKFTAVFSTYISSAVDTSLAFEKAGSAVTDKTLLQKLAVCRQKLEEGLSFPRAVYEARLYLPAHGRMLLTSTSTGRFDEGLQDLVKKQWSLAESRIDHVTQVLEPGISAAIACSVGILLISIMLPLIGIMNSIG